MSRVADPYSRNWVVAAPTLVGNVIGGALGAPFYVAIGTFARCKPADAPTYQQCNWAAENMGGAIVWPAVAVGSVTGTPFLPIAYLFPEQPVQLRK